MRRVSRISPILIFGHAHPFCLSMDSGGRGGVGFGRRLRGVVVLVFVFVAHYSAGKSACTVVQHTWVRRRCCS